jgi:hypothetical protein
MFSHSTYIIAAYAAATFILAWCALAPVFRTRSVRARLARMLSKTADRGEQ